MQCKVSRSGRQRTEGAGQSDGHQTAGDGSDRRVGGEPDFVTLGGPGKSIKAGEVTEGFCLAASVGINDGDGATVIALCAMLAKCDAFAVAGNSGMTDPSGQRNFVDDLADGILDAVLIANGAHHEQVRSIGGPVGPLDILKYFSRRRSAGKRRASQCTERPEKSREGSGL